MSTGIHNMIFTDSNGSLMYITTFTLVSSSIRGPNVA